MREAVQAALDRAKEAEPVVNSYVTLDEAGALAQAEEVQKKIDAGELTGPLAGVPVAVKDNMCIKGQLTTCSSKILSNFKPHIYCRGGREFKESRGSDHREDKHG